jgi:hypothetical protein
MTLINPIPYTGFDISENIIQKNKKKYSMMSNVKFDVMDMNKEYVDVADLAICVDTLFHVTIYEEWLQLNDVVCKSAKKPIVITTNTEVIREEYFPHVNFKRKILPVLQKRNDIIIEEVVTQKTHKESNSIILTKIG